jgi:hypothetical protein
MRKEYPDTELAVKGDEFIPAARGTFLLGPPRVTDLVEGFPMRPVPGQDSEAFDPVHPLTALGAVERGPLEWSFGAGLISKSASPGSKGSYWASFDRDLNAGRTIERIRP